MTVPDQVQCVDCRCTAPPTGSYHTLISAAHGWRLSRTKAPDGSTHPEWRCPNCWKTFKAKQATKVATRTPRSAPPKRT